MVISQFRYYGREEMLYDSLREDPELWDLYTRREEYEDGWRDSLGRFPFYISKNREVLRPLASERLVANGNTFRYPDDRDFAICLTHDIDIVFTRPGEKLRDMAVKMGRRKYGEALRTMQELGSRKIPHLNFDRIIDLEQRYGANSSFYFMVERPGVRNNGDWYNYSIDQVADQVRNVDARGCEVGLHGGHTTYNDPNEIVEKKKAIERVLGKEVHGYRNHFLRFDTPRTWRYLADAGFEYDTTFGYADCVGFRNGMCHPYLPYDRTKDEYIDLLELPLVVMDCTLDTYMRLEGERVWDMVRHMLDVVRKNHGVCTILWHNTYMDGERGEVYERILRYGKEHEAWMTSGKKVSDWWRGEYL